MGMFFPCLMAAILNGCALQMFREPMKMGNGPLMALYIFIFTAFILLWSVRVYPRNLRKIGKLQFIVEFLVVEFLMEDLIIDFWFPLESSLITSLGSLAQTMEEWLLIGDWSADFLIDFLKAESTGFYASYAMAIFFLLCALHASRGIDLRTLTQEGPGPFFKEIIHRMKINGRRLLRRFGLVKRKVKINELQNSQHPARMPKCRPKELPCRGISISGGSNVNKHKRCCPLFDPYLACAGDSDESDLEGFEDLGKLSNSNCSQTYR